MLSFAEERNTEAIPGSSFFTAFYQYHKDNPDCRIFLLGAMEGVAQRPWAYQCLGGARNRSRAMSPSYGFENKPEEKRIDLPYHQCFRCQCGIGRCGAPKQEKWIFRHKSRMPGVDIWMALGLRSTLRPAM